MEYTWDDIEQYVAACTQCPLGRTRHLPVMGCGNHSADIQKLVDESATRKLDQHDYCKNTTGIPAGTPHYCF